VCGLTTIFLVGGLGVEDEQKGHLSFLKENKHRVCVFQVSAMLQPILKYETNFQCMGFKMVQEL
jgi:hypothetical protein